MGEPNATVDPFLSAGIRLPTQGIGYDGVEGLIALSLAAGVLTPVPRNIAGDPMSVDIPFAAVGDIIEVKAVGAFASDLGSGTPATTAALGVAFQDSSTIPIVNLLAPSSGAFPLDTTVTNIETVYQVFNAVEVPATWTFPVTAFLIYVNDGDMVINVGAQFAFSVRRYPVQRSIGSPTTILV